MSSDLERNEEKIREWRSEKCNSFFSSSSNQNGCENTCLPEEQKTKLTKSIFNEEFDRRQQNMLNIISGNFDTQMREIRELTTKLSDLKPRIHGRYTGGKSEWLKTRKREIQN